MQDDFMRTLSAPNVNRNRGFVNARHVNGRNIDNSAIRQANYRIRRDSQPAESSAAVPAANPPAVPYNQPYFSLWP